MSWDGLGNNAGHPLSQDPDAVMIHRLTQKYRRDASEELGDMGAHEARPPKAKSLSSSAICLSSLAFPSVVIAPAV